MNCDDIDRLQDHSTRNRDVPGIFHTRPDRELTTDRYSFSVRLPARNIALRPSVRSPKLRRQQLKKQVCLSSICCPDVVVVTDADADDDFETGLKSEEEEGAEMKHQARAYSPSLPDSLSRRVCCHYLFHLLSE